MTLLHFDLVPDAIRERLALSDAPHPQLGTHCWLCYAGRFTPNGYARVYDFERKIEVVLHRFLYKLLIDPALSNAMLLDHLCRTRRCVNPWHLEPVSHAVNTQRGKAILFQPLSVYQQTTSNLGD